MKTVLQRVRRAQVRVEGEVVGEIQPGVVLLVGIEKGDSEADALATARKIATLRVFPGKTPMDLTLADVSGACLVISQFTLAAAVNKGRRPSFDHAEDPQRARTLYLGLCEALRAHQLVVETGRFGAMMEVELVNDGPVTLLIISRDGIIQPPL